MVFFESFTISSEAEFSADVLLLRTDRSPRKARDHGRKVLADTAVEALGAWDDDKVSPPSLLWDVAEQGYYHLSAKPRCDPRSPGECHDLLRHCGMVTK